MKQKTTRLAQGIRNQHVAMSVAAGLARAQLVPNPVGVYDARHLSEMLEVMATAIASVSITRGDVRHAVAVLQAIGFQAEPQAEKPQPEPARAESFAPALAEIEHLVRLPLAPLYIDKVNRLAMEIVRAARVGPVVNHAMQLISALHHARVSGESHSNAVSAALDRLQQAVERTKA